MNEQVVVVAGGTSGVGLRTAERFAAVGTTRILLIGRDAERGAEAESLAQEAGAGEAAFVSADILDPSQARLAVASAVEAWGRVDVLVNASNTSSGPSLFHEVPIEHMRELMDRQVMGMVHMCSAVLPAMRERHSGSIVNLSSDAAKVPTPGEAIIGAGMAALVMFSKTLAMEAKRDGIRVNVVTPSIIRDTGGYRLIMDDDFSTRLFDKAMKMAHLGVPSPDDLASLILFLASDQAARITGQAVSVNGGISAV